jgi:hypothetical protein
VLIANLQHDLLPARREDASFIAAAIGVTTQ